MREWLWVVGPFGPVIYFLVFPDQLPRLLDWLMWARYWIVSLL
jgi:hypothetical protein